MFPFKRHSRKLSEHKHYIRAQITIRKTIYFKSGIKLTPEFRKRFYDHATVWSRKMFINSTKLIALLDLSKIPQKFRNRSIERRELVCACNSSARELNPSGKKMMNNIFSLDGRELHCGFFNQFISIV